eukprot:EC823717.1.p1 GENE.EC823717.1~~EC823717.1.p1  ORF type:complete len:195 (-),score=81.76 EC823717.1:47-631(-)
MGNKQQDNNISKNELEEWTKISENKLTKKDIQKYRKIWVELFGKDGEMTKEGFRKWIQAIGAFSDLPEDAPIDHLFRSYDRNRDGKISFEEFIIYLSITAPSTNEQDQDKLIEVTFQLYDIDGDGFLTKKELIQGMRDTFKLLGHDVDSEKISKLIEKRVDTLVKLADENNDGQITLVEIKQAVKKDPKILSIF